MEKATETAKTAYETAWGACKAFPPTDWSKERRKAFAEARDAWYQYLKAAGLAKPQKRR